MGPRPRSDTHRPRSLSFLSDLPPGFLVIPQRRVTSTCRQDCVLTLAAAKGCSGPADWAGHLCLSPPTPDCPSQLPVHTSLCQRSQVPPWRRQGHRVGQPGRPRLAAGSPAPAPQPTAHSLCLPASLAPLPLSQHPSPRPATSTVGLPSSLRLAWGLLGAAPASTLATAQHGCLCPCLVIEVTSEDHQGRPAPKPRPWRAGQPSAGVGRAISFPALPFPWGQTFPAAHFLIPAWPPQGPGLRGYASCFLCGSFCLRSETHRPGVPCSCSTCFCPHHRPERPSPGAPLLGCGACCELPGPIRSKLAAWPAQKEPR